MAQNLPWSPSTSAISIPKSSELRLDEEAVRIRILALLKKRGRLTNAEIRRFSGFHRLQLYRLIKGLEAEGKVWLVGKGRSAHIVLIEKP